MSEHLTGNVLSLHELPTETHILAGLETNRKKHLIEQLSAHASTHTGMPRHALFDTIMRRERLDSTDLGNGIALPHVVYAELKQTVMILKNLKSHVDFGSADNQLVDILCLINGPEHADLDHLKYLSCMS